VSPEGYLGETVEHDWLEYGIEYGVDFCGICLNAWRCACLDEMYLSLSTPDKNNF
jgi:hypothetical protein